MVTRLASGTILLGLLLFWLLRTPAATQKAKALEPELIESIQGPALYSAYCAGCHGENGKGRGPMAKSLKVAPPDLTRMAQRNGGKFPLERTQNIISGEKPATAAHGTRAMPVWGPVFSQFEWDHDLGKIRVYNLAKYIEQLQAR